MTELFWLILLLPLAGFLIAAFFGKKMPSVLSGIICTAAVSLSFLTTAYIFVDFINTGRNSSVNLLFEWIAAAGIDVSFSFLIDELSLLMTLIITGVGSLIHLYSIGYMKGDEGFSRFFSYLNLFIFSMLILVLSSNYLLMFVGWEGVGLCSWLLIGFWYKEKKNVAAANKAFIMNRIGDLGFLLGMILIFLEIGTLDYASVFEGIQTVDISEGKLTAIALLLFVGAIGKSAQIPLYTWLPDAMAGPTPVSALIHAATMVTAGVYMVVRSNILYSAVPFVTDIMTVIALTTILLAAFIALKQNDIKKVLAYSTVSQLGFMFLALGMGAYSTAIFHLATHAFFKALLFLGAGSVIHAMGGEQDIRKMGGLKKKMRVTFITFLIGTLAIAGLPPFAGFFSKDEILAHAFAENPVIWVLASLGAVLTAVYMFRLLYLTFYGKFRGTTEQADHLHESPKVMTFPLMKLAFLSAIAGFLGIPALFGHGKWHLLDQWLAPIIVGSSAGHAVSHEAEYIAAGVSVVTLLIVIFISRNLYIKKSKIPTADGEPLSAISNLLYNKFYVDEIYEALIVRPVRALGRLLFTIDRKVVDGMVNGAGKAIVKTGKITSRLQTGNLGFYVLAVTCGVIVLLIYINLKH